MVIDNFILIEMELVVFELCCWKNYLRMLSKYEE